jgi:hypothetical protein
MLIFHDAPGSNLGPEVGYANKVRGFPESLQRKKKVGIVPGIRSRPLPSTQFPIYQSAYEGPNLKDVPHILVTFCIVCTTDGFVK